jgi:hypothetical protein
MTDPRDYDRHVALFSAYADAVAALSPESWHRLTDACAPLDGDAVSAIVRRARLSATSYRTLERLATDSRVPRWIDAVSTASIAGIHVATDLLAEFDRSPESSAGARAASERTATGDAYVDAWFRIESALEARPPSHPGLATAVRAAGQAVLRHDWLLPATFAKVYGFVESEIPYQDVERRANES